MVVATSLFLGLGATASATTFVSTTDQLTSAVANAVGNETIVLAPGTYAPAALMTITTHGLIIEGPPSGGQPAIISGSAEDLTTQNGDIFDISAGASMTLQDVSIRSTNTGVTAAINVFGSLDMESSDAQGNLTSAVFAQAGSHVVIRNSSLVDNSFASSVPAIDDGGDVQLFNDTVAQNDFGLSMDGGTAELVNTLIVDNTLGDCLNHAVTTADASMDSNGSCGGATGTTHVAGMTEETSPGIAGSVGFNGGTTSTFALVAGSPAIGAGDLANCPAVDQRGVARIGHCDVGAFQLGATLSAVPISGPAGNTETVSWSGVAVPSATDWIGVYAGGATDGSFIDWFYAGTCGYASGTAEAASGSCTYTLPSSQGSYDFILYTAGSFTILATSNPVNLNTSTGFSASPATTPGGGSVSVAWANLPHTTSTDWVGVYQAGQTDGAYLDWFYAGTCGNTAGAAEAATSSCKYTMPTTPGTYDFIIYAAGSYHPIMTSNAVTVTTGAAFSASPASVGPGGSETVSWAGVPNPTSTDWVGVYQAGQTGGAYVDWFYAGSCSHNAGAAEAATGSCAYTMPSAAGSYDFVLYAAGTYHQLMASNTVTVT